MRARKVLRTMSPASGRTLSGALGRRACTDSFLGGKGETSRDTGCGQPRQKVPCLPLSKSAPGNSQQEGCATERGRLQAVLIRFG